MIHSSKEISHIEKALQDLVSICEHHSIDYRVFGSTAYVAVVGTLYRIPADVDVFVDKEKLPLLKSELKKISYQETMHDHIFDMFLDAKLSDFSKGPQVIELAGATFTDGEFREEFGLPIPFINKKVGFFLWSGKKTFKGHTHHFGKAHFLGISKEAYFVGISIFIPLVRALKSKTDKRMLDYKYLREGLNETLVKGIIEEKSGIYFGRLPALTTKTNWYLYILIILGKIKKSLDH